MFKPPQLKQSAPTIESATASTKTTANSSTQTKIVEKESAEIKLASEGTESPVNLGKHAQG